jgi:hypothetical protein
MRGRVGPSNLAPMRNAQVPTRVRFFRDATRSRHRYYVMSVHVAWLVAAHVAYFLLSWLVITSNNITYPYTILSSI